MRSNNVQLVSEVLDSLNNLSGKDTAAAELATILQEPHFKVIPSLSWDFGTTLAVVSGPRGSEAHFLADLSDLLWDVESPGGQTALLPHCRAAARGRMYSAAPIAV